MSQRNSKRALASESEANKRAKRDQLPLENVDELVVPKIPPRLTDIILAGDNENLDLEDFGKDPPMTVAQKAEVSAIRALLKKAYEDSPIANFNPELHALIPTPWHKGRCEPDNKSLAYVLYIDEGWTEEAMKNIIGKSQVPIPVHPLDDRESRWLWASLRFSNRVNSLVFEIDIPPTWLTEKMKAKVFAKKVAKIYAQKLAALVAFNQASFFGKGKHWFRPLCEDLGVCVTANFVSLGYIIIIFVVCVDANIFEESTKDIEGNWGDSSNRAKVAKAFIEAVKKAERNNNITYPKTFQLFKNLFPYALN